MKIKKKWDVKYEVDKLHYVVEKHYWPDFTCSHKDGRTFFIEVKGWLRPEDRTKMIAVKRANPDVDIRFIFASDNKLNRDSNTRYSDWCNKHGFRYCIGVSNIPKEWFN